MFVQAERRMCEALEECQGEPESWRQGREGLGRSSSLKGQAEDLSSAGFSSMLISVCLAQEEAPRVRPRSQACLP